MMTLILFIVIFGVVVIAHEFGHFLLANAMIMARIKLKTGPATTVEIRPHTPAFWKEPSLWSGIR